MSDQEERIKIESELELLAKAEATPAFGHFRELLILRMEEQIRNLLLVKDMRTEDEHDLLTRARANLEMLDVLPGRRWKLYNSLNDLQIKVEKNSEAAREKRMQMKNADAIQKRKDWMMIKPQERM